MQKKNATLFFEWYLQSEYRMYGYAFELQILVVIAQMAVMVVKQGFGSLGSF